MRCLRMNMMVKIVEINFENFSIAASLLRKNIFLDSEKCNVNCPRNIWLFLVSGIFLRVKIIPQIEVFWIFGKRSIISL